MAKNTEKKESETPYTSYGKICLGCGMPIGKHSPKMPMHLRTLDNEGFVHWADCNSVAKHKMSFPELYPGDHQETMKYAKKVIESNEKVGRKDYAFFLLTGAMDNAQMKMEARKRRKLAREMA